MKTILHVVEPMATGVGMFVTNLASEQARSGDYRVVVAHGIRPLTHPRFREFFHKDVELIHVKNFRAGLNPIALFKAINEVRGIIKEVKPDYIHMHSSISGGVGRLAALGSGIPQIYNPHGFSFLDKNTSKAKNAVFYMLEQICAKLPNGVLIATSPGEYSEAVKVKKDAKLVYNGINTSDLDKYFDKYHPNEQFSISTNGRLLSQKNPALFNEIAKRLSDVKFIWIGDGDLKHLLTSSNIEVKENCLREQALEHVAKADAYIMTSLYEGFSLSLLEAMYLKKPSVVSNVTGNRDAIDNGRTGFVCDTVDDFVTAISTIKEDKALANKLAMNGHDEVVTKYSAQVMKENYDKIYKTFDK